MKGYFKNTMDVINSICEGFKSASHDSFFLKEVIVNPNDVDDNNPTTVLKGSTSFRMIRLCVIHESAMGFEHWMEVAILCTINKSGLIMEEMIKTASGSCLQDGFLTDEEMEERYSYDEEEDNLKWERNDYGRWVIVDYE